MNNIEKQKAFIADLDILMEKYDLKEVIIVNMVDNSIMPSFVQADPIVESDKKKIMIELFLLLTRALRKMSDTEVIHYSDPEEGWHSDKKL